MNEELPNGAPLAPAGRAGATSIEIRVVDIYKSFGANKVLRGVSLEIRCGEIVAIVGASGSGKTVLLKHLTGRLQPDTGKIFIADHEKDHAPLVDLSTLDEDEMDELRRHWAVVFQRNALFTGTVHENIALGLADIKGLKEPEIGELAKKVLAAVGLEPAKVMTMPRDALSGGMAKRVAIARALALDPVLIFYDEPTSGLDPQHSETIRNLICNVHGRPTDMGIQRTSIIVTHDVGLLLHLAPRVIMLHEGKVFFDGPAEEFERSSSPVIKPYLDMMPMLHQRRFEDSEPACGVTG